ncbi:DSD1 family PLP-dependent enzyme [Thalassolituus hydrocarboniclasticus]|uniref:DSD1 family PLP-dependent enzyme n=1 Tax=Thalassolituus hydrocarboniclasticus TaxID=2742796 RepID=A0ABY6ACC1_9GAMM|nr:DSD1 family PLP-dependent enzyme [Thalassolituus hydrocarboniclasticus]UXD88079.1 DSD1 family PLP-dependent enzyme [Thalassolituus hydrocarboniclasticus]
MTKMYFQNLTRDLQQAGICTPTLVIDKERLDRNIDHLIDVLNRGFDYRIVAKSLPSVPLLQYIMRRTGTQRLMSFHLPFLMHLVEHIPAADILMGKPMPIAAARHFYQWHSQQTSSMCFAPELQLQWLIDSNERLQQYASMARELNLSLRINLEIDVGLHRGGFLPDKHFMQALQTIAASPLLTLSGLMGYEAHISKIPGVLGGSDKALQQAKDSYRQFTTMITETLGKEALDGLCLNTGGSSTYPLYEQDSVGLVNEIATASALVKPTDFDVFTLEHHQPAVFIAAPVLKIVKDPEIPMASGLSRLLRLFGRLPHQACFIYGGNWLAQPCYPDPCQRASIFGHSSNQELYELPDGHDIKPDDYLFFRPTQSESVFLQFGNIALYEQGRITEWWPVFSYPDKFPPSGQLQSLPGTEALNANA